MIRLRLNDTGRDFLLCLPLLCGYFDFEFNVNVDKKKDNNKNAEYKKENRNHFNHTQEGFIWDRKKLQAYGMYMHKYFLTVYILSICILFFMSN